MESKRLLTLMAEKLYEDIKFVTELSPTQIVDEDGTRAYNNLLQRTRRQFSNLENLEDFTDWSPRTIKYKDALVVAGQLYAMLRAMSEPPRQARPPQSPPPQPPPRQPAGRGSSTATPVPSNLNPPSSGVHHPEPAPPSQPAQQQPQQQATPKPQAKHDPELYGAKEPPQRNEDGTIPFSLE